MSKRINKKRAIEILEKIKSKSEEYIKNSQTRINTTGLTPLKNAFVRKQEYAKEKVKALDIAIDSLDNEWVDVRDRLPEEIGEYLVTRDKGGWGVMGNEVDLLWFNGEKWFKNVNETDLTYQVIAWKKVEPYERKE